MMISEKSSGSNGPLISKIVVSSIAIVASSISSEIPIQAAPVPVVILLEQLLWVRFDYIRGIEWS